MGNGESKKMFAGETTLLYSWLRRHFGRHFHGGQHAVAKSSRRLFGLFTGSTSVKPTKLPSRLAMSG